MTQRYAHLAADDLKRATEGVSKMLDRVACPNPPCPATGRGEPWMLIN